MVRLFRILIFLACHSTKSFLQAFVIEKKLITKEINMEKFDDLITSNIPVLVDFYAEWCGPCKMMKPILEDVKAMKGEKVRVVKVDVDKHQELAAYYQIQSVPTLMIFKDGKQLWRQSGVLQAKELSELLAQYE